METAALDDSSDFIFTQSQQGVPYYQFSHFREFDFLRHGIFTRQGGVSPPPFDSLNVGRNVGDQEENVKKNRGIISSVMGNTELVFVHQVHGCDVTVCPATEAQKNPDMFSIPEKADAVITHGTGKNLVIQAADCQAVLMADPVLRVIANVHAGWRGSIQNIIGKTVFKMREQFGCRPEHILAGIGPSLGPCCAEFVNYETELPEMFRDYKHNGVLFDFWAISRDQLIRAGVLDNNIVSSRLCTRCHGDRFFSYRRRHNTGRFAAVIGLV